MNCLTHTNGPGRQHRCHTFKLTEPGVEKPKIDQGFQRGPYLEAYDRYVVVPQTPAPEPGDALDVASATADTINAADQAAFSLKKQSPEANQAGASPLVLKNKVETTEARDDEDSQGQFKAILLPTGGFGAQSTQREVNDQREYVRLADISREPRWADGAVNGSGLEKLDRVDYTEHSSELWFSDEPSRARTREQHVTLNPGTGTLTVCAEIYASDGHMSDFGCGRRFDSSCSETSPMRQHSSYTG